MLALSADVEMMRLRGVRWWSGEGEGEGEGRLKRKVRRGEDAFMQ